MSFALGIVVLILGILVSIGLHEIGHMVPAKRFGVKVPEYSIGFGPTLWSVTRGETTYFVKAIPLGGYVRLAGMLPPAKAEPARDANGNLTWAEEARQDARRDLGPGEDHRAFSALPAWKKLVVMFGGPIMNWILAAIIIAVAFVGIGLPSFTSTISDVPECLEEGQCSTPDSPAALAGIQEGDLVTSWGGTPISGWEDLTAAIQAGGTGAVTVVVERDGQDVPLLVEPVLRERTVVDDSGEEVTVEMPFVGVAPSIALVRQPLGDVPATLLDATAGTFGVLSSLPTQLWSAIQTMIGNEPTTDRSVVSLVGVGQMAGSITSAQSEDYTLAMRVVDMLMLLASLNLALFVFNLIPLLPLDGGHIAGALWEGLRRMVARAVGRPDPGPVDLAPLMKVAYWVLGALILMTVILAWADVVAPIAG